MVFWGLIMSDLPARVSSLLRTELEAEAAGGFGRLQHIPYTDIIWFLDYFAALPASEQEDLLDALAGWGTIAFFPWQYGPQDVQELEERHPAFGRYRGVRNSPGYKGGYRYTEVRTLSLIPKIPQFGGFAGWIKNFSGLALQPREDLLPDLSYLQPAKAPLLRQLLAQGNFCSLLPEKKKLGGGDWQYLGSLGQGTITVRIDFGARFTGQLVYGVTVAHPDYPIQMVRLAYERLWDANLGWDYLTEENAPRSLDFLAEQVLYLAKLAERLNGLAGG